MENQLPEKSLKRLCHFEVLLSSGISDHVGEMVEVSPIGGVIKANVDFEGGTSGLIVVPELEIGVPIVIRSSGLGKVEFAFDPADRHKSAISKIYENCAYRV